MKKSLFIVLLFLVPIPSLMAQSGTFIKADSSVNSNKVRFLIDSPFSQNQFYSLVKLVKSFNTSEINTPTVVSIGAGSDVPLFQRIFITPGDTVTFCIEQVEGDSTKKYLKFSGKNSAHYNYWVNEYYFLKSYIPRYTKGMDLELYKTYVERWRDKRIEYFSRVSSNSGLSNEFKEYIRADIQNGFAFYLYYPLEFSGVKKVESNPKYFLNDTLVFDLKSQYFISAAPLWIKWSNDDAYKSTDLVFDRLKSKFKGEQRDYILSSYIGILSIKQIPTYRKSLIRIIDSCLLNIKNPDFNEYIKLSKSFYLQSDRFFPDKILDSTYLKEYGKDEKISLREVISKYSGKPLYIDIWASWCGPCRTDISRSGPIKEILSKNGVIYLYFSIDAKEDQWKKISEIEGIIKNQYLICDIDRSPINKFLKFDYIPFYLFLNSDHKIITTLGPRPVPENKDEFIKIIENLSK